MPFERLECPVMHYAWGERASDGRTPYIAELLGKAAGEEPWAELWIGAHPQASSALAATGTTLDAAIRTEPERYLGRELLASGHRSLPFLLKVLCCSSVLSIQSHPDKRTAERLHCELPEAFPDDNHKPEVIYALSDFELMAGFRSPDAILADVRGLRSLAPWASSLPGNASLKDICVCLMRLDAETLRGMADSLAGETSGQGGRFALFRRLAADYPGDPGVFFSLLLNSMTLKPGEGVHVQANMPHAYIRGRGVECMANSNNVIRAGLTPKRVDRELLIETLDFTPTPPERMVVACKDGRFELDGGDFRLEVAALRTGEEIAVDGRTPAVLLIVEGSTVLQDAEKTLSAGRGSAWYAGPDGNTASVRALQDGTLAAVCRA